MVRRMFHTQEKRERRIQEAIKCYKDNAWLGVAWYFWYDEDDAVHWGNTSKTKTGEYEIYDAQLDCSEVLDTVFSERDYLIWVNAIKKAQKRFLKAGKTPTLKMLNDFFYENKIWSQFSGIMFQDISNNSANYISRGFQYKKRIQLAVFNPLIITNFAFVFEGKCV